MSSVAAFARFSGEDQVVDAAAPIGDNAVLAALLAIGHMPMIRCRPRCHREAGDQRLTSWQRAGGGPVTEMLHAVAGQD
jgi:hypothetical protein